MGTSRLLIVDADVSSARFMQVSLRGAGHDVELCARADDASRIIPVQRPHIVIADTKLPDMSGYDFVTHTREAIGDDAPSFILVSSDLSVSSKIRGLELGVREYLTKPVYLRELLARVNIELSRAQRARVTLDDSEPRTRFTGSLDEMSVVDLLQTVDVSGKTGVLYLLHGETREPGAMYFENGRFVHAICGAATGEDAVFRLIQWTNGTFNFEIRDVRGQPNSIHRGIQPVLIDSLRLLDEDRRSSGSLVHADARLDLDSRALIEALGELPDGQNTIIRAVNGKRTFAEVVERASLAPAETIEGLKGLIHRGVVKVHDSTLNVVPIRPPVEVEDATDTFLTALIDAKRAELSVEARANNGTRTEWVASAPNHQALAVRSVDTFDIVERPSFDRIPVAHDAPAFLHTAVPVQPSVAPVDQSGARSLTPDDARYIPSDHFKVPPAVPAPDMHTALRAVAPEYATAVADVVLARRRSISPRAVAVCFAVFCVSSALATASFVRWQSQRDAVVHEDDSAVAIEGAHAVSDGLNNAASAITQPEYKMHAPSAAQVDGTMGAEARFRAALVLQPDGLEALDGLAWLMLDRENFEESRRFSERAVASDASCGRCWLALGTARTRLGDQDGARKALARCVEHGSPQHVVECRSMLR